MSKTKLLVAEDKSTGLNHNLNHSDFEEQINKIDVQLVNAYVDRIVLAGTSPNEKWKSEVILECRNKLINLIKNK